MSKLTKAQAKAHAAAVALLAKDRLGDDDKWFVLENWREDANHVNTLAGAFFTPPELARSFAIETSGADTIIDLCAGIGGLLFAALRHAPRRRMVCVEANPDYVAVGRKLIPEAEWICADVFALPALGRFDLALSNPPFGSVKRAASAPRYTGRAFEYHVIDAASDLADFGVFIIPQMSAPFTYSGKPCYTLAPGAEYRRFERETGIELGANCGIDCSFAQWRSVAPAVEIVTTDFAEAVARRALAQADLFAA